MTDYEVSDPDVIKHEKNVTSALNCQQMCLSNQECHFFTLNTDNNKCWLKKEPGVQKFNKIATSGPAICKGSKLRNHCILKYTGKEFVFKITVTKNFNMYLKAVLFYCLSGPNMI
jgi:hypothetical protein